MLTDKQKKICTVIRQVYKLVGVKWCGEENVIFCSSPEDMYKQVMERSKKEGTPFTDKYYKSYVCHGVDYSNQSLWKKFIYKMFGDDRDKCLIKIGKVCNGYFPCEEMCFVVERA